VKRFIGEMHETAGRDTRVVTYIDEEKTIEVDVANDGRIRIWVETPDETGTGFYFTPEEFNQFVEDCRFFQIEKNS